MYSFMPDEEQQMLVDVVRRYAINALRPAAHEAEERRELPGALIEKGWELGVLQASVPGEYGGFGERAALTSVLAAEELAYGDLAGAMATMMPGLFALPILMQGSEEQKTRWLPEVVGGGWRPFTAALMEYQFDFDPAALHTTAKLEGSEFVLNGLKRFVPFANQAEQLLVYADFEGETQAFIVPAGHAGITIGEREKIMGLNALPLYPVHLDEVRLPSADRLGGAEGHAVQPLLAAMRVAAAALAVGVARAAFDYARDYAKDREVLGSKVAQKQSIAFMLAEMATEIEAIRLLTWEAAWLLDRQDADADHVAFLAQQGAVDMVMMVTDRGVQILGGHGYIREHPVELWMRNGRGFASLLGLAIV